MLLASVFGVKCCHASLQRRVVVFYIITTCRALLAFDWMTNVQSHGLQALN